ncbi:sensor histidine kinase [Streptomyces sp. RKND-216]|uniref:ATP-binding protein n=1 Tax=Streptomyces sp. RKND-216 TaxID=2562581 RepID=UPI00109DC209|nr:ATP-binding protein [Streptomyces sp. RKND-216]THA23633.1 sensor histidine kinase [Streptomyces sp. RKND-216]
MPDLADALRPLVEAALVCALVLLSLRLRTLRRLRRELAESRAEVRAGQDELARHRARVLPEALAEAHQQAEEATQGLLRSVARTVQGLANSQQKKITDMLRRHDDPDFVEDLLVVDHTNAQILRRSAGITVVCGSWPGRQHDATPLVDVVRGAVGRILDYRRVRLVRVEDGRGVVGRVVEGLVLTLAELLENATRYSNPSTLVQVHLQLTHHGLAVVIEDAGIGLNPAERERVARVLAPDGPAPDLTGLGNPPHFGLVVCALLARRYGFTVHVDGSSAFGGVRAVVNLPSDLLTDAVPPPGHDDAAVPAVAPAVPAPPPRCTAPAAPAPPRQRTAPADPPVTAVGLPRRVPRTDGEGPPAPPPGPPATADPDLSPAPLGGFLRGSRAARHARPTTEGNPEP